MVKIIPSMSHELGKLKTENKILKEEKKSLQLKNLQQAAELQRLRCLLQQNGIKISTRQSGMQGESLVSGPKTEPVKSYPRPTRASTLRKEQASSKSDWADEEATRIVSGNYRYRYEDAGLIKEAVSVSRQSSVWEKPHIIRNRRLETWVHKPESTESDSMDSWLASWGSREAGVVDGTHNGNTASPEMSTTGSGKEIDEDIIAQIARRTRYHSCDCLRSPLQDALIDNARGYAALDQAYRIAQEAFYHATKKYHRELWRKFFRLEPHVVNFGTSEIHRYFTVCDIRGTPFKPALTTIHTMASLRNTICHRGDVVAARRFDQLLAFSQSLCIAFADEARAQDVRALRDDITTAAGEFFREIEERDLRSGLANVSVWEYNHEEYLDWKYKTYFTAATRGSVESPDASMSRPIWRAVLAWGSLGMKPGEYEERMLGSLDGTQATEGGSAEVSEETGFVEKASEDEIQRMPAS